MRSPLSATATALLLLAACVERPLDGSPGGAVGNAVAGYAPGPRWEARVEAFDAAAGRFAAVPLYDARGRPVHTLRAEDEAAEEAALLSPTNAEDALHRYAGFYDLPAWAWRFDRARVRIVMRPPGATTYSPAFAYSSDAYHRCLVTRSENAGDLHALGAHCADRRELVLVLSDVVAGR